jgi:copper chaperone NosL
MIMKGGGAKMKTPRILLLVIIFELVLSGPFHSARAEASNAVSDQTRCSVCGMFVAKYPNWLAQIQYADVSQTRFFDGPKDMMAFYFNPEQYGGPPRDSIRDIFVKDYYGLDWLPAREAFYVIGSDIYGPMGHELIPFGSREAAESFSKDHHGTKILTFEEITPGLVESLRLGQKMR